MKKETLDKIMARIDRMDRDDVQSLIMRLAADKGLFQDVFDALRDGLILFDPAGTPTFANRAACHIYAKSMRDLLKLPFETLVGMTCTWRELKESGVAITRDLLVNYPEKRHYNFCMTPLGEQGEGYLLLIQDDTESRALSEADKEAEQFNAVAFLAAGIAHEIGNPLNAVDLHLQLMRRQLEKLPARSREKIAPLLDTARQETARLDAILKQFLQAIRPAAPQLEKVDVNRLIGRTLDLLTPEIAARGISVRLNFEENLPTIDADPIQLSQVFYNVIRNAYQSIPNSEGGIFLQTTSGDTDVRILVGDTGSGISHEVMGSLYEPFRTTKKGGNGLGLLIVRRIVKDHGGTMTIASKQGLGTTVTISLPRLDFVQRLLPG